MTDRNFRDRQLPLDGGIDVLITGNATPEYEVFIEYRSDSLVIYTGERAHEARGKRRGVSETASPSKASPRVVPRLVAPVREDPDWVPPPVVPRPGDRPSVPRLIEASPRDISDDDETILEEDPFEIERAVIQREREEERQLAEDSEEPPPPLRTSTVPRSPIDRSAAQRNALKIDTVMHTSMGETHVTADLSGMLRRG